MGQIIVVGGGAAGMMAALRCAAGGHGVTLLEKNEKLGKKLYITGKGRCNITNACDVADLFSNVVTNAKFLYSAFYGFTNEDAASFFDDLGLRTKVERGNRVFPVSDKSSDVIKALRRECERRGVRVRLNARVREVLAGGTESMAGGGSIPVDGDKRFGGGQAMTGKRVRGVLLADGTHLEADAVILATGGLSYPSTGSTGDGYRMAEKLGHTVTALRPGLTGMTILPDDMDNFFADVQGLTLKNVTISITRGRNAKKRLYEGMGELLFTHYGVSGPLVLSASSLVGDILAVEPLALHVDLKPALSAEQLDQRILRDFDSAMNLDVRNALVHLLPKSLIPVMLSRCGIRGDCKVNRISRDERGRLRDCCKDLTMTLTGLRPMEEAVITRGGICVKEVDPATMASKKVEGLYFAGEMLDVDALTGGFNLQIAWSTGYAAGNVKETTCSEKPHSVVSRSALRNSPHTEERKSSVLH